MGFYIRRMSMNSCLILCALVTACAGEFERNVTSFINHGCNSILCKGDNVTLLYVNAIGSCNTIHQIWDFTRGRPTIITAVTKSPITMSIEWNENQPFSFHVTEPVTYAFAVVINKIWEFNDLKDFALFDPEVFKDAKAFDTSCFHWNRFDYIGTDSEAMIQLTASGCQNLNGNFTVKLDLLPFTDYSSDLPHLIHSSNSTQMDIILDHLISSKLFNSSRFALELMLISDEKINGSMFINIRKGLDDEHTPGIFEVVEILTPETLANNDGGFIQYRPVTYIDPERDVETSRNVSISNLWPADIPHESTADIFFSTPNAYRLVEKAYITLGSRGDGFYQSKNYSLWTFTVGYGSPPIEGFSMFIMLVMGIGLGVPALLMVAGGIYVCLRRKRNINEPERLRD